MINLLAKTGSWGRKFVLMAGFCAVLVSTPLVYGGLENGRMAPAIERIKNQGYLTVAMKGSGNTSAPTPADFNVPPFLVLANKGKCPVCNMGGTAQVYQDAVCGFDVEVAHLMAKKLELSLKLDLSRSDYDDVVAHISNGEADIAISTLSRTLGRTQYVAFTEAYLELDQTLLVNRRMMKTLGLTRDDLIKGVPRGNASHSKENDPSESTRPLTIAVEEKSSYVEFAHDLFKGHEIKLYPSTKHALKDLMSGSEVFAIHADNTAVAQLLTDTRKAGLYLSRVNLQRPDVIVMAGNYRDVSLLSWANMFLRDIKASGELDAIKKQCGLMGMEANDE